MARNNYQPFFQNNLKVVIFFRHAIYAGIILMRHDELQSVLTIFIYAGHINQTTSLDRRIADPVCYCFAHAGDG
jgi:hypothetical protein